MKQKRIVYVSCNPASLASDIAILLEFGYAAKEIQPVDMFSETSHVECVVLRTRCGLNEKIRYLDYEMLWFKSKK